MFEGFKVTKTERESIDTAWCRLVENTRDTYRSLDFLRQETYGYGKANDRIPLVAAKGLCLQWFLEGVAHPDKLLRECYFMRPAAIWFQGMGGSQLGTHDPGNLKLYETAVDAYKAAFKRMHDKNVQGIKDLQK